MGFEESSNSSNSTVTKIPSFQLKGGDDILRDEKSCHDYAKYQQKYRAAMTVYPELDKKNCPVCAVPSSEVLLPIDLKKTVTANAKKGAGQLFGGAIKVGLDAAGVGGFSSLLPEKKEEDHTGDLISCMTGMNLIASFEPKLEIAVHPYKYAYSLLSVLDFEKIDAYRPAEIISDEGLGFVKSKDGRYWEGTWKDGTFVYGLIYIPGICAFIGTFNQDYDPREGVMYDFATAKYLIGSFKNGMLDCEYGVEITLDVDVSDDEADDSGNIRVDGYDLQVGKYENGLKSGEILRYSQSFGEFCITECKYEAGKEVKLSRKEQKQKKLETTPLISRLFRLYLAAALDVVALVALFGAFGKSFENRFLGFAAFGLIGGFCTYSFIKMQMAVTKKKKQTAELKKEAVNHTSK